MSRNSAVVGYNGGESQGAPTAVRRSLSDMDVRDRGGTRSYMRATDSARRRTADKDGAASATRLARTTPTTPNSRSAAAAGNRSSWGPASSSSSAKDARLVSGRKAVSEADVRKSTTPSRGGYMRETDSARRRTNERTPITPTRAATPRVRDATLPSSRNTTPRTPTSARSSGSGTGSRRQEVPGSSSSGRRTARSDSAPASRASPVGAGRRPPPSPTGRPPSSPTARSPLSPTGRMMTSTAVNYQAMFNTPRMSPQELRQGMTWKVKADVVSFEPQPLSVVWSPVRSGYSPNNPNNAVDKLQQQRDFNHNNEPYGMHDGDIRSARPYDDVMMSVDGVILDASVPAEWAADGADDMQMQWSEDGALLTAGQGQNSIGMLYMEQGMYTNGEFMNSQQYENDDFEHDQDDDQCDVIYADEFQNFDPVITPEQEGGDAAVSPTRRAHGNRPRTFGRRSSRPSVDLYTIPEDAADAIAAAAAAAAAAASHVDSEQMLEDEASREEEDDYNSYGCNGDVQCPTEGECDDVFTNVQNMEDDEEFTNRHPLIEQSMDFVLEGLDRAAAVAEGALGRAESANTSVGIHLSNDQSLHHHFAADGNNGDVTDDVYDAVLARLHDAAAAVAAVAEDEERKYSLSGPVGDRGRHSTLEVESARSHSSDDDADVFRQQCDTRALEAPINSNSRLEDDRPVVVIGALEESHNDLNAATGLAGTGGAGTEPGPGANLLCTATQLKQQGSSQVDVMCVGSEGIEIENRALVQCPLPLLIEQQLSVDGYVNSASNMSGDLSERLAWHGQEEEGEEKKDEEAVASSNSEPAVSVSCGLLISSEALQAHAASEAVQPAGSPPPPLPPVSRHPAQVVNTGEELQQQLQPSIATASPLSVADTALCNNQDEDMSLCSTASQLIALSDSPFGCSESWAEKDELILTNNSYSRPSSSATANNATSVDVISVSTTAANDDAELLNNVSSSSSMGQEASQEDHGHQHNGHSQPVEPQLMPRANSRFNSNTYSSRETADVNSGHTCDAKDGGNLTARLLTSNEISGGEDFTRLVDDNLCNQLPLPGPGTIPVPNEVSHGQGADNEHFVHDTPESFVDMRDSELNDHEEFCEDGHITRDNFLESNASSNSLPTMAPEAVGNGEVYVLAPSALQPDHQLNQPTSNSDSAQNIAVADDDALTVAAESHSPGLNHNMVVAQPEVRELHDDDDDSAADYSHGDGDSDGDSEDFDDDYDVHVEKTMHDIPHPADEVGMHDNATMSAVSHRRSHPHVVHHFHVHNNRDTDNQQQPVLVKSHRVTTATSNYENNSIRESVRRRQQCDDENCEECRRKAEMRAARRQKGRSELVRRYYAAIRTVKEAGVKDEAERAVLHAMLEAEENLRDFMPYDVIDATGQPSSGDGFTTDASDQPPVKTPKISPSRFEEIRDLDEQEKWRERVTIVTAMDHEQHVAFTRDIILDIISALPVCGVEPASDADASIYFDTDDNIDNEHHQQQQQSVAVPSSPALPIARGSYNVNWDEIDENSNPFGSASKAASKLATTPIVSGFMHPDGSVSGKNGRLVSSNSPAASPKLKAKSAKKAPLNGSLAGHNGEDVGDGTSVVGDSEPKSAKARSEKKKPALHAVVKESHQLPTVEPSKETTADVPASTHEQDVPASAHEQDVPASTHEQDVPASTHEQDVPASTHEQDVPAVDSSVQQPVMEVNNLEVINNPATSSRRSLEVADTKKDLLSLTPTPAASSNVGRSLLDATIIEDVHVPTLSERAASDLLDDEFRPATEVFSDPSAWDALEKFGCGKFESDLSRQSLYVRFDPLISSDNSSAEGSSKTGNKVLAGVGGRLDCLTEDADGEELMALNSPLVKGSGASFVRGPRTSMTDKHDSVNNNNNVDVLLACSPMPAAGLRNGPMTSGNVDSGSLIQTLKYSEAEVSKMQADMEAKFEERLRAAEKEWIRKQQGADDARRMKEQETSQLVAQMDEMSIVLVEYEKTMQQLSEAQLWVMADKEALSAQLVQVAKERDQAMEDIGTVEASFTQLHQRYEKLKGTVDAFKQNEETLKKSVLEMQSKLKKQEEKYAALKKHSEEKLQGASEEIARVQKQFQAEVARLEVSLKRAELRIQSQEQTIEQKTKQNQELESICDELLSKVKSAR